MSKIDAAILLKQAPNGLFDDEILLIGIKFVHVWDLLLKNFANKGIWLNAEETAFVQSVFLLRKFRKNQFVLQQGDVARYETFVVKGFLRTYIVDDKGQEHVMKFSPEDWWAGDLSSFFTELQTSFNIDCLEPTEVLQITKNDLQSLLEKPPEMNVYFRVLYQNSVIAFNQRIATSLCMTASGLKAPCNISPKLQACPRSSDLR